MGSNGEIQGWDPGVGSRVGSRGGIQGWDPGWDPGVRSRSGIQGRDPGVGSRGEIQGWAPGVGSNGEIQGWIRGRDQWTCPTGRTRVQQVDPPEVPTQVPGSLRQNASNMNLTSGTTSRNAKVHHHPSSLRHYRQTHPANNTGLLLMRKTAHLLSIAKTQNKLLRRVVSSLSRRL